MQNKPHAKPIQRRWELIKRIASGETTKEIALNLGISAKTVEYHWARAKVEFGFQCVQDATKYAIKNNLITI